VAEAEFFIHEVKIIVKTLAVIGDKVRLAALFVVPRLVGRTRLHRRENADKPRMIASFRQQLLCAIFLPDAPRATNSISMPVAVAIRSAFSRIRSRNGSANCG
jgi:hypothetical protein